MHRQMMSQLIKWKNEKNRKPLLLKGVRQVGKTHLLKEFGSSQFAACHYFNFEKQPKLHKAFEEDLSPKAILKELSFQAGSSINIGQDLVIFDEIQECPKALTSLKYFCEECPQLHLCGAGSLLGLHLNSGSFPVGKVTFKVLCPLSFEEFLMATNDKALEEFQKTSKTNEPSQLIHEHLWEQLKTYFVVGGLPEVVASYCANQKSPFEAFTIARQKQEDLLNAYYADIARHSGKVNAMHIDRCLRAVPMQLCQIQDGNVAKFKFRGVVPGISHYDRLAGALDWLESAGLIIKVQIVNSGHFPFRGYTKENFFKLLLFDVGILGSMCGLPPKVILDADYGSYKGYFAENFVAQEFLCRGFKELFSWQEDRSEVEYLLEDQGSSIPVEVKSGSVTKAKSLEKFTSKYKSPYQVIFSGRPMKISKTKECYPLYLAGKLPKLN